MINATKNRPSFFLSLIIIRNNLIVFEANNTIADTAN